MFSVAGVICTKGDSVGGFYCDHIDFLSVVQGALNVASDIYVLVIPIVVVLGLSLVPRKKMAVLAVFLTGML